jgi:hypothetical protein
VIPIWRHRESSKKAIWGLVVMISMEDGEGCKRTVMLRMVPPIDLRAVQGYPSIIFLRIDFNILFKQCLYNLKVSSPSGFIQGCPSIIILCIDFNILFKQCLYNLKMSSLSCFMQGCRCVIIYPLQRRPHRSRSVELRSHNNPVGQLSSAELTRSHFVRSPCQTRCLQVVIVHDNPCTQTRQASLRNNV